MLANSCKDDPVLEEFGKITGLVTDDFDSPLADVTVSIDGTEVSVTTGTDGTYVLNDVQIKTQTVTFTKEGFQTVSVTVSERMFNEDKQAEVNVTLINANAHITGRVTDAESGDAPLQGVLVKINESQSVETGEDGVYVLEYLTIDDYTVTFSKENYTTITKSVTRNDFVDGVATVDVQMSTRQLLRGLSIDDLNHAPKWYYNEYRGGRNSAEYPHWDWACDYMATMTFWGAWEEQNEGTTLQIRNNNEDRDNPADLEMFDSYVYGKKKITDDNKILSLRVRTHNADEDAPAYFGVQVVDLTEAEINAVKIDQNKTLGSPDYTDFDFDLSAYVGKEIIIAVGIYRAETGDYWKQLVLRAIRFADQKVEGWNWLPGNEVIDGWKLTEEMVRSTMVNTNTTFTGVSPVGGNRDSYFDGYRSWVGINHVAVEWSFVPLRKDPEVFASQGFLIKTRNTADVDYEIPEAYFYAKFAIAAGTNEMTFKTRNFGENYTYFKITVVKEDGSVTHVLPKSNTADEAAESENSCLKFKHGDGGIDNPEGYADFVYDLSQFNGNDVVIAIGVYNGEANTGENKLVFYNIDFK